MSDFISISILFTLIGISAVVGLILIREFFDTFTNYLGELQHFRHLPKLKKKKQEVKDTIRILKIRYARGEIKKEEYEEMKKVLTN